MDPTLPPAPASSARPWYRDSFLLGSLLALVTYGILLGLHTGAWAGGSDSSGYLNNARLLRAGQIHESQRALPGLATKSLPSYTYIPLGFLPVGGDHMVPTYPIGLSLLMVAVSLFSGWPLAPHVTLWLHAMAGVLLTVALARACGVGRRASAVGALLLAACPLYIFMGTQAMSDVPAVVWCTAAGVFSCWSRRHAAWALAAGLGVAIAVLVRPSDLLIVIPVALALGLDWRRWLLLGLGGLPGAIFLGLFNRALYGQVFTTGYGAVGGIFQLEYAPPALDNYLRWLPVLLTPALALILGLPWAWRRGWRRTGGMLLAWVVTFLGFYVFYFHTHETWWYLRFILPAFPALIVLMLVVAEKIAARQPGWSHPLVATGLALGIVAWSSFWCQRLSALDAGRGKRSTRTPPAGPGPTCPPTPSSFPCR